MKASASILLLILLSNPVLANWVDLEISNTTSQANITSSAYGGAILSDGSNDLSLLWDDLTVDHLSMTARMCDTSKTNMTPISYVDLLVELKTNGSNHQFNLVTSLQYIEYTTVVSPNLDNAYYVLKVFNYDTQIYTLIGNRSDEGAHDYNISLSSSHMDGSGFVQLSLNITQTTQDCEAYNQVRAYEFEIFSEMNVEIDSDGDGIQDSDDLCPNSPPGVEVDENGCALMQKDSDLDGYNDFIDKFPNDPTQYLDSDGDGCGDNVSGNNSDDFPNDETQCKDLDGDGYGDNISGVNPDRFPLDATQWKDQDGDGYGDNQSGNNPDAFVNDASQWNDSDGDGHGDNPLGNNPDAFMFDETQWSDVDGDGYGDNQSGNNPDAFVNDASQWNDLDRDGYGDNPLGNNPDAFMFDETQWSDVDGDGYGDNQSGNNPDAFVNDPTQWNDSDGDGFGDNKNGFNPDAFPTEESQWIDEDGDGFGENLFGVNPDMCPGTLTIPVDSQGCSESQKDDDNDGVNNSDDLCELTDPLHGVDVNGCSPHQTDFDNDGVMDAFDQCNDTPPRSPVMDNGCPELNSNVSDQSQVNVFNQFKKYQFHIKALVILTLSIFFAFILIVQLGKANLIEPEPTEFEFIEFLQQKQQGDYSEKRSLLMHENTTYKQFLDDLQNAKQLISSRESQKSVRVLEIIIERMESKVYVPIGAVVCFRGLMTIFARKRERQLQEAGIKPSKSYDGKQPSGRTIFNALRNGRNKKMKKLKLHEFPDLYQELFLLTNQWNSLIHVEDEESEHREYEESQMKADCLIMMRFIDVVLYWNGRA